MTRSQSGAVIKYETPQSVEYPVDDGRLSINFDVSVLSSEMFYNDALSLKESASMVYELNNALTLEELKGVYALFEDLLILLTDSDCRLGWPSVVLSDESRYRWYFARIRNVKPASAPQYFECWTNFKQLRETFGSIWANWKKKREESGAGIYLYLGTRRGIPLYLEHRFVNLLWGIESFHRTRHAAHEWSGLSAKIQRIIEQVSLEKDKKWLEKRLRHAGEPSLEERIFDAFKDLPTDIDHARLRAFCKTCADLRNAISHYGGHRQGSYTDFIRELDKRSNALSTLYHTLLLKEIGVDEKILRWWIYEGFRSYPIKANFVEVGLLDKSSLKVENMQGAGTTTGKK
jgi:ApeA N-terminal domain 1